MGEWVVLRPSAMLHQGGALDTGTQLGKVLGFDTDSGDGRQGTIWMELYQHDELSRRFEPAAGPREVQIPWRDANWSIRPSLPLHDLKPVLARCNRVEIPFKAPCCGSSPIVVVVW